MKKVILLFVLGLAITFVNAQDSTKKATTKTPPPAGNKATRTPVKTADLLKAITDDLAANYKDYKVTNAFKLVKNDAATKQEVTTYLVNVEKGTGPAVTKLRLEYDADGKFLSKKTPPVKPPTSTKTTPTTPANTNQDDQKK